MKERHWLNKNSGHAFIEINEQELIIGDCNRIITLEFWIDKYDRSENNTPDAMEYKIDNLYNIIKRYRTYIKKEIRKERKKNETS